MKAPLRLFSGLYPNFHCDTSRSFTLFSLINEIASSPIGRENLCEVKVQSKTMASECPARSLRIPDSFDPTGKYLTPYAARSFIVIPLTTNLLAIFHIL